MHLQKLSDGTLRLSRMNSWEARTLQNIPALADFSNHDGAERRLLPSPVVESDLTPEMAMDWVEYVVPELRDSFAENLGTVMADLEGLKQQTFEEPPPLDNDDDGQQASGGSKKAAEADHPADLSEPANSGKPEAPGDDSAASVDRSGSGSDQAGAGSDQAPSRDAEPASVSDSAKLMEMFMVDIPAAHAEAWFRAMNQARLVLSARHGFDSEHLPDLASLLASGKLEHLFQYELFVSLQGRIMEVSLDPDADDSRDRDVDE